MDDERYYFEISIEIDGWPWYLSEMFPDEREEELDRQAA